jgi:hypothetical protein
MATSGNGNRKGNGGNGPKAEPTATAAPTTATERKPGTRRGRNNKAGAAANEAAATGT